MKKTLGTLLTVAAALVATSIQAQCPEITINEKYDHIPTPMCAANGWDTLVNCRNTTLILHANPFITTQHFNGTYAVESIPYDPVDPTFHAGTRLNISSDDSWENAAISFPFTFMFFGYPYTQAVVGSNGIVSFDLTRVGQPCQFRFYEKLPIPNPIFPEKNAIYGVIPAAICVPASTRYHSSPGPAIRTNVPPIKLSVTRAPTSSKFT